MIVHYFDGNQIWELQEPPACHHYRLLQLFQYIQQNQHNDHVYQASLDLLRRRLHELGITEQLIPENLLNLEFINEITSLFVAPELPNLEPLTNLLDDSVPAEYTQSSNNYNAYWLNALYNIFENMDAAIKVWTTQPMSVVQSLIFERRQAMLLNLVKDKLTPDAITDRKVRDLMQSKIDDGTATDWVMNQISQPRSEDDINNAKGALDDIKFVSFQ